MRISERRLSAQDLGVPAIAAKSATLVGSLTYDNYGWVIDSSDSRFRDVVTRGQLPHHPCGYEVTSYNGSVNSYLSFYEPLRTELSFSSLPGVRAVSPKDAKAIPPDISFRKRGYHLVATQSVGPEANRWFGLMHPDAGRKQTLVVQFGTAASGIQPKVLATLPIFLDTIEVLPDIHSSREFFNLRGKDVGGSLTFVQLSLGGPLVLPWEPKSR